MGDAAPSPLPPSWPSTRPRRSPQKPKVTYRRSPGAASKPVPRPPPIGGRVLGTVARFIPFRAFVDLFFGGVSSNAERAAATEQSSIDYLTERQLARLARGTERRVTVARTSAAARPAEIELPVPRPATDRVARVVPNPLAMPAPELARVGANSVSLPEISPATEIFSQLTASARGGAPPRTTPPVLPKLLELPQLFPQFFSNFSVLESPLLTPFKPPGVASSPLASPLTMAEPLPQPEPQRCRCRAPKRRAGKPGKGFFTIDAKGRESRRYWQNREARSHARNAS